MKTIPVLLMILISLVCTVSAFALDVKLEWDPNSEVDLAGYKVYYGVNGLSSPVQVDVNNQTLTTIAGLDPAKNYSFAVAAYNTSGQEGPYSNVVTVLESVLPVVSITSPADNSNISNTVNITANATDNVGVIKGECYVDGILKSTINSQPYQYSWDTSAVAAGTHFVVVKAYDAAGNIGTSAITVTVIKDVTPPAVSAVTPAAGSTVKGSVNVSCNATDNVAVTMVEFYVNGVIRAAVNSTPYSYTWDTTVLSDGNYLLTAKAYDAAGNSATTPGLTVTVKNTVSDTTAPVVSAFTMPATATSLTVSVSSLTATDATGVTGYMITENSTAPTAGASGWSATAPTTFTFSAAGTKTAYAWVKDGAGNVSAGASRIVTITLPDVTAPVISAFTMPATATSLTVSVSSLTASDATGVTGYMITESSTAPTAGASGWSATVPTSFTFSVAGSTTAFAWTKDAAGNVSAGKSALVTITLSNTVTYSIGDALQALRIASGKVKGTSDQISRLDVAPVVNGKSVPNGTINSGDVTVIMSKLVGKSSL